MAVDYKPLNRNQTWSTPEKEALRGVFALAETAAAPSDSSVISRTAIQRKVGGRLNATEQHGIRTLFAGLRDAMDTDDTGYVIKTHIGSTHWSGQKHKIITDMAQAVVDQISAS